MYPNRTEFGVVVHEQLGLLLLNVLSVFRYTYKFVFELFTGKIDEDAEVNFSLGGARNLSVDV